MSLYRLRLPSLLTWDSSEGIMQQLNTGSDTTTTLTLTGGSTVFVGSGGSPGSSNTFSYDVVSLTAIALAADSTLTSADIITSLTYNFRLGTTQISITVPTPGVGDPLPNLITIFGADTTLATWFATSDLAATVLYQVTAHFNHAGETSPMIIGLIVGIVIIGVLLVCVVIYFMTRKSRQQHFMPQYYPMMH